MSLLLTWKAATSLPVDGAPLRPETIAALSPAEAARLPLRCGNEARTVGDLFDVRISEGGELLTIEGDLRPVYGIGRGMARGRLVVRGDAGPQLGAEMAGGRIDVFGNVGAWAGAEMREGILHVRGDAADFLGAAYPGSRLGMRGGAILLEGRAGEDAGLQMRRGLIAVRGDAGGGLGRGLIAGTILALGAVGRRVGAGMKRGTIVLPGLTGPPESFLPPTFAPAGRFATPFLRIYLRQLAEWGFDAPGAVSSARLDRYNGDLVAGGQGEILAGRCIVG